MALAPIALFAYDRPIHLQATVAALAANPLAAKSDLVIFSDGPKNPLAGNAVAAVRDVARVVTGFRSVRVVERTTNAGLVRSITEGVGQLVDEHGRLIVVEDDLITSPRFLEFMNGALERYEAEESVMQISGYMYPVTRQQSACFLPTVSCWGWATWARAWKAYDASASFWSVLQEDPALRRKFDLGGAYDYSGLLERHLAGKVTSWGVLWYLSVFARQGLILHPPQSLVSNLGFDGSGSHGSREDEEGLGRVELLSDDTHFLYPSVVGVDDVAFDLVKASIRGSHRGWRNWLRRMS